MKKKRKRKKKEIQLCSKQYAVASAPNRKLFTHKKKPVKHQENTPKRLLVGFFFFFWLVWFVFLGWVGLGFEKIG